MIAHLVNFIHNIFIKYCDNNLLYLFLYLESLKLKILIYILFIK